MEVASHENGIPQVQIDVEKLIFAVQDTMATKCAVELRITDIIHSHGSPMSLSQITSSIGSSSTLNLRCLESLMRFLVRKKLFTSTPNSDDCSGETVYGLTQASRYLLHDSETTLAPLVLMRGHPWLVDPWQHLSAAIKEGETPFDKAHGSPFWELASTNPDFNDLFIKGLGYTAKALSQAVLSVYKNGFQGIKTLVDVGGGNGDMLYEIVKANSPRVRGINFDLQHVIDTAPAHPGVTHMAGDMFESIPSADCIILKTVLHDWSDEDCRKILRNCRRAISETKGKLVLLEVVLDQEGKGWVNEKADALDLFVSVFFSGGRERSRVEWTKLLEDAGFLHIEFIETHVTISIIEAYPA